MVAMDLEGVFVPEIWIAVAEKTGIAGLRLTTRDISDYDQLMAGRIAILKEHGLTLSDIQAVIETLEPLSGAVAFLTWLRSRLPLVILSDTFGEFALPLLPKLGYPTIFCNSLEVDEQGMISGYRLRQRDGKRAATLAFQGLGFRVLAAGDSYNDTTMLATADAGVLFCPPANVIAEFPQFPVVHQYDHLREQVEAFLAAR